MVNRSRRCAWNRYRFILKAHVVARISIVEGDLWRAPTCRQRSITVRQARCPCQHLATQIYTEGKSCGNALMIIRDLGLERTRTYETSIHLFWYIAKHVHAVHSL